MLPDFVLQYSFLTVANSWLFSLDMTCSAAAWLVPQVTMEASLFCWLCF